MDYRVILSPQAIRDLETIVRYVAITNPELAKKLGQQLLDKTCLLYTSDAADE